MMPNRKSQPLSISAVPAWVAACGSNQELMTMACMVALGFTVRAPIRKALVPE